MDLPVKDSSYLLAKVWSVKAKGDRKKANVIELASEKVRPCLCKGWMGTLWEGEIDVLNK